MCFREICDEIYDGPHATPEKIDRGPVFLSISSLVSGRIDLSQSAHLSEQDFVKWTRRVTPQKDDLVFSYETRLGEAALIPEGLRCCLGRRMALIRAYEDLVYPKYLLYFFLSPLLQNQIRQATICGSTVERLALADIAKFRIPLPPLAEQKAIAAVLGALDDKIELNRRMNATLESMARALFQSWFVDFDPVRAKLDPPQADQPTALDPATAALFPSSFEDSELGHIPKGWNIQPVGEVVDCVGGGTPSTAEPKYWEGGTHHWTTPKDFSSLQAPVLLDTDRKLTDAGIAKISSGLLPAGTLLLSSRAPVGYLAIAAMPVAINQGFIALKCNERASNFFMLNWCQKNMAEIEGRATGTTFAEISKQNFRPIPVVLPPKELMAAFTAKVASIYAQITANLHQSRTLATLRDTLLPKLLSGELSVAAAAEQQNQVLPLEQG
jgi:type I restriction enzyme S subunit